MNNDKSRAYITREAILQLLSDDEVANVSTAETAAHLADGDEYLDLEQLDLGVQWASATTPPMGRVLPCAAVHPMTWVKILNQLADLHKATMHDSSVE